MIALRMPEQLEARLRDEAEVRGVTITELVCYAITRELAPHRAGITTMARPGGVDGERCVHRVPKNSHCARCEALSKP